MDTPIATTLAVATLAAGVLIALVTGLLPLVVARRLARRVGWALAPLGSRPAAKVSLPRLGLWRGAIEALGAPHARWQVSACPGWVVLLVDTLQGARRVDADTASAATRDLAALAEALEARCVADGPRWDPAGYALPAALVWGLFLAPAALCPALLPPALLALRL